VEYFKQFEGFECKQIHKYKIKKIKYFFTVPVKSLETLKFTKVYSAHQGCIYLIKKRKNSKTLYYEILLQGKITIFYLILFYLKKKVIYSS